MNFGIVTGAAPNQKDLLDISAPNIKSYCEAYDYKFDFFDTNLSPWTKSNWSRFPFRAGKVFKPASGSRHWLLEGNTSTGRPRGNGGERPSLILSWSSTFHD